MNDKIQRIADALDANRVDYDKDFRDLESRGYASDACQSFSDGIVDSLGEIVAAAVDGGGFGPKERDAIEGLIRLALRLSDKKAPDKLVKFGETKTKILAGVPAPQSKEGKMNIKEEVLKYVSSSERGAEVVLGMNISEGQKALLRESCDVLKQIAETVGQVWDNSSVNAANIAGEAVEKIIEWRKKLSVYMCDRAAVESLKAALGKAEEWKKLDVAPKKREIAKEDYIAEKVGYETPNDVERIIDSVGRREGLTVFQDALARFDEETERRYGTKKLEKERDGLQKHKDDLYAGIKSLTVQYRNGEISAELALPKIKRMQREMQDLDERIESLDGEINEKADSRLDRDGIRREFQRLNDRIMEFENDPAMFATLSKNIDLVELSAVLLGRKNAEEMKEIASRILAVFDMMKVYGGFTEEVRDSWRSIRQELRMEREKEAEREPKRPVVNAELKKKQAEDEMEALLREMDLDGENREREKKERQEESPAFIPLSENDK